MTVGVRERILAAGLLLAVVAAGVFALLLYNLRDANNAARQPEEAIAAASRLETLVLDLETGGRGFVITGQPRFLEPWRAALVALPGQEAALERLARDDPRQEADGTGDHARRELVRRRLRPAARRDRASQPRQSRARDRGRAPASAGSTRSADSSRPSAPPRTGSPPLAAPTRARPPRSRSPSAQPGSWACCSSSSCSRATSPGRSSFRRGGCPRRPSSSPEATSRCACPSRGRPRSPSSGAPSTRWRTGSRRAGTRSPDRPPRQKRPSPSSSPRSRTSSARRSRAWLVTRSSCSRRTSTRKLGRATSRSSIARRYG